MKKVALIFSLLAICGLVMGCGGSDDEGNKCDQWGSKLASWMTAYCNAATDCCYCDCMNENKMIDYTVTDSCACMDIPECVDDPETPEDECNPEPVACEGQVLTAAEACLADEAACQATQDAQMDTTCAGWPL